MHGGAKGTGAPSGDQNGNYRHGTATREELEAAKQIREWIRIAIDSISD